MHMSTNVIDVTEATFETEVLQRSLTTPVVIDFWADWCGPCHALSPIIEKAVEARNGSVVLAKVDVDANPRLAQAFQIQGIPAVKAVAGGRLVDEFVGVRPPDFVEQWLDGFAPRGAEALPETVEAAAPSDPAADAERWRATLETEPDNLEAALGLAGMALAGGDADRADELLKPVAHLPEAAPLLGRVRLTREAADSGSPYAEAAAQANDGAPEQALATLLGAVRATSGEDRDRPRQLMLDVFRVLGGDNPLTQTYRRRLTTALF
jgi:putative thioredoxin